ncbi:hypothetical protein Q3G72_028298 [Acer saccharum]|nr:hypothetical protein Q3G72_028298 [Acer saccharum]
MSQDSQEKLVGIVERVTFHSSQTGWSLLKVSPFQNPASRVTVCVHQAHVFAGATMEFHGHWRVHPKYGEQFQATQALERKPASSAALERYLGSGLIDGVGPKTARKIVAHFGAQTLAVFEEDIERLTEVRGIAKLKLQSIRAAWMTHRAIRDVMLFLQEYGVSTLFAVKIFKTYGNDAIKVVRDNPYQLARDIYGIGFFSADRIALALGFAHDSPQRIEAGVAHVLNASREQGHCYMTRQQILDAAEALLGQNAETQAPSPASIGEAIVSLEGKKHIRTRHLPQMAVPKIIRTDEALVCCYYATSLYWAEERVAQWIRARLQQPWRGDAERIKRWLTDYCGRAALKLSGEQQAAVQNIVGQSLSILTGGPGCGKTTTTRVVVKLLQAMGRRVVLAAPTGRAAQRMAEVIGCEAKTLHRLLEWDVRQNAFSRNQERPLDADFVVVDETSMLDITLAADLFAAIAPRAQALLIGDPEQLPAIGAGNVLSDMLACRAVPRAALREVFRQAKASQIIEAAHAINRGQKPSIASPLAQPDIWRTDCDCLFIDAEQATGEQLRFVRRAKAAIAALEQSGQAQQLVTPTGKERGYVRQTDTKIVQTASAEDGDISTASFVVPPKFAHVRWETLAQASGALEELKAVLRRIHPHSALHYGMSAVDVIVRLCQHTLVRKLGRDAEIQVLTPMQRGPLGAQALNQTLQTAINPPSADKAEVTLAERVLRVGDRVIQRRNNYDQNVFNGDIGHIVGIDPSSGQCAVQFGPATNSHQVRYRKEDLHELALAYAITIHKSQGSEFECAIIPISTQHYTMLFRNLIYTALTRAKKMAVFVGTRGALDMAIANVDTRDRQTSLPYLLDAASIKDA